MSGDGGTIRSVVSKTIKITPKMPSSFARPYWNFVNDQMETIRRTDGNPALSAPSRRFGGLVRSGGATLLPVKDSPQRRCARSRSSGRPRHDSLRRLDGNIDTEWKR